MPYHHGRLREALLAAAERTLRAHGEEGLSLRDLAREIGVSHAAPRRHFPDRRSLLDALAEAGFERLNTQLRTAYAAAGGDYPAQFEATVAAYIRFATEDAALLELMFASKHRPGADRLVAAAAPALQLMYEVIAQGQAAGALTAGDPERVGILLFATVHGIATLINGAMVPPELLDGLVPAAVAQFLRAES